MKANIQASYHAIKAVLIVLSFCLLSSLPLSAQTPWAKKSAGAVFTLKTFAADGSLLGSSNGFFVGDNGDAVSCFTPFKNAQRAVVIDNQGKEMDVEYLLGANDTYDVAKFHVATKKSTALPIARQSAGQATAWLLPYAAKKQPTCIQGNVTGEEHFQEKYDYYTLNMTTEEQHVGCPVVNDAGEAIGILQPSAGNQPNTSHAVSAAFAADLRMTGLSLNDPSLRLTAIAKALPDSYDEALLSLYMAAAAMDEQQYSEYLERFIQQFPNASDGYVYRARAKTAKGDFAGADADLKQAVKVAEKKDDAHYQYAQLVYQKAVYQDTTPYEPWSLDLALQESQQAYAINPQPVYRQQQAQILFAQKKYEDAYSTYLSLVGTELNTADLYYAASQCKLQQGDRDASLALLDSAVNTFTKPFVKTAAPYLIARAQALFEAGKYRSAVNDYNDYEQLMSAQLTPTFYYLREQAEMKGHLFQQALDDIRRAVQMAPTESLYLAEQASVELRVGMTDEALATARQCIAIAPDQSEGYLLLGLAQCVKGQKAEGLQNLSKAKELGNDQAQSLIDKYSK